MNADCHIQICMNNDVSEDRPLPVLRNVIIQGLSGINDYGWPQTVQYYASTIRECSLILGLVDYLSNTLQVCGVNKVILLLPIPLKLPWSWIVNINMSDIHNSTLGCLQWKSLNSQWERLHTFTVWAFKSIKTIFSARILPIFLFVPFSSL